jgi:hypothetical protein
MVKAYQDNPKQGKYTFFGNRWQPIRRLGRVRSLAVALGSPCGAARRFWRGQGKGHVRQSRRVLGRIRRWFSGEVAAEVLTVAL